MLWNLMDQVLSLGNINIFSKSCFETYDKFRNPFSKIEKIAPNIIVSWQIAATVIMMLIVLLRLTTPSA
jgi:hypothetical protein